MRLGLFMVDKKMAVYRAAPQAFFALCFGTSTCKNRTHFTCDTLKRELSSRNKLRDSMSHNAPASREVPAFLTSSSWWFVSMTLRTAAVFTLGSDSALRAELTIEARAGIPAEGQIPRPFIREVRLWLGVTMAAHGSSTRHNTGAGDTGPGL